MRSRSTTRWGIGKLYPSPEFWTPDQVTDGLHTIQIGNQLLDILIRNRKSPVTVVTFQHRVSVRTAFPTLVGDGFSAAAGTNLIAIADPSVAMAPQARLAWYLGNRPIGKLKPILSPIVDVAIEALKTERTIFFGNSGGGYPALEYAAERKGAIALTVNPMLGFNAQNETDFADYMAGCHPGLGRTAYRRVYNQYAVDLADTVARHADFAAAMYHNTNDQEYYLAHHRPFIEARMSDLRLYERLEEDEPGHTPIPKDRLISIMSALMDLDVDADTAVEQAGFLRCR